MTPNKAIQYSQLPAAKYTQHTLGANSGTRIETDQIRLEPLLVGTQHSPVDLFGSSMI